MTVLPYIQQHIKLWYRAKLDQVPQKPIEEARKIFLSPPPVPSGLPCQYHDFKHDGFTVRLFYPEKLQTIPTPLVVFIRASGYAFGTIDNHNLPCALLANSLGCLVAGIEHRLAPEFKYPIPLLDCERAYFWLLDKLQGLKVDPQKLILWSECSGGNLACALSHRLSKKNQNHFVKQIMLYPPLDHTHIQGSKKNFAKGYMVDQNILNYVVKLYLNDEQEKFHVDVSPSLDVPTTNLPPTVIHIGEFDLFVDETKDYVNKLKKLGVDTEFHVHPGLTHGFSQYYGQIPQVTEIFDKQIRQLREILYSEFSE